MQRTWAGRLGIGIGAAWMWCSADAFAQDLAVAEAQFNRGLEEMEAGRYDTGCPALAESQKLDPRPGTLFTLADCEAKWGRIATAMARYEDYLSVFSRMTPEQQAKQQGREAIVAERKATLAAKVPKLTLRLPPEARDGASVQRGEARLSAASLGVALPVDPGSHVVVVDAPGRKRNEIHVTILEGESKEIVLVLGARIPDAPAAREGRTGGPPSEEVGGGQRTAAFVAGGVGIAALTFGVVAGGVTWSQKSAIDEGCQGGVCDAVGFEATQAASMWGLVSTVGFGVGAAGLGLGAVLLLTAPDAPRDAARVDVQWTGTGASVQGAF